MGVQLITRGIRQFSFMRIVPESWPLKKLRQEWKKWMKTCLFKPVGGRVRRCVSRIRPPTPWYVSRVHDGTRESLSCQVQTGNGLQENPVQYLSDEDYLPEFIRRNWPLRPTSRWNESCSARRLRGRVLQNWKANVRESRNSDLNGRPKARVRRSQSVRPFPRR